MQELIELPFKHSRGAQSGIDLFRLEELYIRQTDLNHRITDPHKVGFYMLVYIESGRCVHTIDFQTFELEPDTLAIISKHQVQQFDPSFVLKGYIVLITEEFLHRSLFDFEEPITRLLFEPITTQAYVLKNAQVMLPHIQRLTEEYEAGFEAPHQDSILTRELGILLIKAERLRNEQVTELARQAETSPRLVAFRDLLDEHYTEHWTASQYADALGCSRRTLGTLTRDHLNRSPKEVIDERLHLEIKRLLAHTDLSIKEIAYQLGFEDPSNLNKFFRRLRKDTPTEFRSRVRHRDE